MNTPRYNWRTASVSLLSCLSVMGCASNSPPTLPAVSKQVVIPSKPVVIEPLPSGGYWTEWCRTMQYAREQLKTTLKGSERCKFGPMPSSSEYGKQE